MSLRAINSTVEQPYHDESFRVLNAEQTNGRKRVAILGAGPAGVGTAWQLARSGKASAIVIEQRSEVGGNSGSFELDGIPVDYGSHRLHPSCKPEILDDIRSLLDGELLDRPRHGRIRLRGRWIHFPLKPQDLVFHLPLSFGLGVSRDALQKLVQRSRASEPNNFAAILEQNLGSTICRDFYFPYAKKIWGLRPEDISATQAKRRVSAGSLAKMARKVIGLVPGFKKQGAGRFFYPRRGYGHISRSIADAARELGADIRLNTTVRKLRLGQPHQIEVECEGRVSLIEADHVWSTIPLSILAQVTDPPPPAQVFEASRQISYRAMILIYLVIGQRQFTPFDAHYFPESDIKLTRLSEPKNYSGTQEPADRTVLCGELPCEVNDETWLASDQELAQLMQQSLERCGLPIQSPILNVTTKRLPYAYPIYREGYESPFATLDEWAASLGGVLTFGRQGLFAHDNTHHALAMAYAAVDCLQESGAFNEARWQEYRAEFAEHVVED
jgi:protoporphyrinogen oxidase